MLTNIHAQIQHTDKHTRRHIHTHTLTHIHTNTHTHMHTRTESHHHHPCSQFTVVKIMRGTYFSEIETKNFLQISFDETKFLILTDFILFLRIN